MEIHVNYSPLEWAQKFHTSPDPWVCLSGGLGGGKSSAAIEELKVLALENPGSTYLIGRKTLPSLKDTTMKTFFARMEDGLIKEFNKTNSNVTLINGSEFIFRPLDDLEKMKSLEISGFFVDEANEISQDMFNTLQSRCRQQVKGKPPTMYRGIIALNPGEEDHWIPQLFFHVKPKGHSIFSSTTMDNMKNLPEGYIENLKAMYTPDMQQRMIYGMYGRVHKGKAVFPQFSRGSYIHAIAYDPKKPLIRGWDFGYNRPVCMWAQMHNMQIRILAEMMGKEVYLKDFIKDEVLPYELSIFGKQEQKTIDFCDPRGSDESDKGRSSVQVLNDHGIYPAYRRTWIEEGINIWKTQLDTIDPDTQLANFVVHPRAKMLIEALKGGYHRDGDNKPVKDGLFDNIADATRYLILHSVQRAKIGALNRNSQATKVYTNPHSGRRVEF